MLFFLLANAATFRQAQDDTNRTGKLPRLCRFPPQRWRLLSKHNNVDHHQIDLRLVSEFDWQSSAIILSSTRVAAIFSEGKFELI